MKNSILTLLILNLFMGSTAFSYSANLSLSPDASVDEYVETQVRALEVLNKQNINNLCPRVSGLAQPALAKTITFTFDDGPSAQNTPKVLDILKKYNIKAIFFVQGQNAKRYPAIMNRIRAEGHLVGNHTYDHAAIPQIDLNSGLQEIFLGDQFIAPYMKDQKLKLFRYPYGAATCESIDYILKGLKYTGILGWHIDTCDWAYSKNGIATDPVALKDCPVNPKNISSYHDHVMEGVQKTNGGIILMHDIHARTVNTLEDIVKTLIKKGYKFNDMNSPGMDEFIRKKDSFGETVINF